MNRITSTIDQHLAATQIRLLERAVEIGLDVSSIKPESVAEQVPPSEDEDTAPRISLETRQYDYRKGYNPLFRPFTEADRYLFILTVFLITNHCCRIVVLGPLTRQPTHDGIPITTLHKELTDIRKSREDVGCNCKQVKLDKLNVAKLKQELISHQETFKSSITSPPSQPSPVNDDSSTSNSINSNQQEQQQFHEILTLKQIDSLSKSELINRLRGVYKSCPLCILNDCSCVISGVGCHSNVCCCFRAGGIKNNCDNPEGYRIYNAEMVKEYRKAHVTTITNPKINSINSTSSSSSSKSLSQPVRSRAYST